MIQLRDFTFSYSGAEAPVLNRVNLTLASGELVLVAGPTGSGKSTLLRALNGLVPNFTGGKASGQLLIDGTDYSGAMPHELADVVGFVNQQPEGAFVADTVLDELAFGLEQLGVPSAQMRQRIEKYAAIMGIEELLERPLAYLSGGQQQRVAIAAALVAEQKVLVLDEPTSALDAEATIVIIKLLRRLADELGITVVLAEHRIERVIELCDSVVVVSGDGSVSHGSTHTQFHDFRMVPPVVELSQKLNWQPLEINPTAAAARWAIEPHQIAKRLPSYDGPSTEGLRANHLSVHYSGITAIDDVSVLLNRGEVVALMGPNGSGKTSLLWALQGTLESKGEISSAWGDPRNMGIEERMCAITMIPQRASDLLYLGTLAEELEESDRFADATQTSTATLFSQLAGKIDPSIHPRDLSSGQQLALVIAMQLVKGAGILLLDEPTRGLDYVAKQKLADQFIDLRAAGKAILFASHDVEFVAMVADRVLLLENGTIADSGPCEKVLTQHESLWPQMFQVGRDPEFLSVRQVLA